MRTLRRIIKLLRGDDYAALLREPIVLHVDGLMDLHIEAIGPGPRGKPSVSVAHYYRQNGDAMADPDLTLEFEADGSLTPTSYTQHNLGIYQEVFHQVGTEWQPQPKLLRDLTKFARDWDLRLMEQGFLAAAQELAKATS